MKDVIILPTYNERENIALIIPRIFEIAPEVHVAVVDDNSPDGTAEVVMSMVRLYPNLSLISRERKEGLGAAYADAILRLRGDPSTRALILMDADGSHDPSYLPKLRGELAVHDMVIGSRYISGGGVDEWELWRRLLSRFGNQYARILTGMPVNDITAGFIGMSRPLLEKIDFTRGGSVGYAFLMELKHAAIITHGARYKEIPIAFAARREGESKLSHHIIREGIMAPLRIFWKRIWNRT